MPNYKGHIAGGVVTFFGLVFVTGKQHAHVVTLAQWFVFTILGALFPDVDIHSKGRKIFFRILLASLIYFIFKQDFQACFLILAMGLIPLCVKHRGIFHNTWFIIFCTAIPVLYAQIYHGTYAYFIMWDALFFGCGALSHLFLDFGPVRFFKKSFGL
jgi:hypothetical protein